MPRPQPVASRFWSKVDRRGECWVWMGATTRDGYGSFRLNGRMTILAHRYAYEAARGPIPHGLTIDHLCRNRLCVRLSHLEVVTIRVNVLRGESANARNARKTECKHGHPFDAANTLVHSNGSRRCRACKRARDRVWRAARRARTKTARPEFMEVSA